MRVGACVGGGVGGFEEEEEGVGEVAGVFCRVAECFSWPRSPRLDSVPAL